jgi:hypothetical protein
MQQLKDKNVIANNVFGIYLAYSKNEGGLMTIGGYNVDKIKSGASINYFPLEDSFYWQLKIDGFRVGKENTFSDNSPSAYLINSMNTAIVDTGMTFIYVPKGMFVQFIETAFRNVDYEIIGNSIVLVPCDVTILPSVFIYVNGLYIEITPDSYVTPYIIEAGNKCDIAF